MAGIQILQPMGKNLNGRDVLSDCDFWTFRQCLLIRKYTIAIIMDLRNPSAPRG